MTRVEWFGIPVEVRERGLRRVMSAQIRLWQPGDGISCASAAKQRKAPCTAPIGVIEVTSMDNYGYQGQREVVRTSPVCGRHIAQVIRGLSGDRNFSLSAEADRAARERVLVAHWDEYQAYIVDARREIQDAALGTLPAILRDAMVAAEGDQS